MGSPADWGAFCDAEDGDKRLGDQALCLEVSSRVTSRMVGQDISVSTDVGRGRLSDSLVLSNASTGERLVLVAARFGAPVRLCLSVSSSDEGVEGESARGQLVSLRAEQNLVVLRLQRPAFGPFVERLPLLRRALLQRLPSLVTDEVLAFLDRAWIVPPCHEVSVSVVDDVAAQTLHPLFSWWPVAPRDWRLTCTSSGAFAALNGHAGPRDAR